MMGRSAAETMTMAGAVRRLAHRKTACPPAQVGQKSEVFLQALLKDRSERRAIFVVVDVAEGAIEWC